MRINGTIRLAIALLSLTACLGACGRQLQLEARQELTPDDLKQNYQVTIFATASGPTSFNALATFSTPAGAGTANLTLPAGDTLTLNGTSVVEAADVAGNYQTSGSGNPGVFEFIWTHGTTIYKNTVTATPYQPATVPTTFAKSAPQAAQIQNVPIGVTVTGTINAGSQIAAPFFNIPVTLTGGGASSSGATDFTDLSTGLGVVAIRETSEATLQALTAGGGSASVVVQYGYNATITD